MKKKEKRSSSSQPLLQMMTMMVASFGFPCSAPSMEKPKQKKNEENNKAEPETAFQLTCGGEEGRAMAETEDWEDHRRETGAKDGGGREMGGGKAREMNSSE